MDDNRDPRRELYQRFRQSLQQSLSQRYFDEDELVELYDYAGDIQDDYVQLEVLLCGARLYPESGALRDRRLLYYLDTTADDSDQRTAAADHFLEDNSEVTTPLFDIARATTDADGTDDADAAAALEYIVSHYDSFNDEEAIRLVEMAAERNQLEWVVKNIDRIADKVQYKPAFYFEIGREADEADEAETLVMVADRLIELEPFNVNNWIMLFRGHARLAKREETMSSYEAAKALAADDPMAMLRLADSVFTFSPTLYVDMEKALRELSERNPDNFDLVDAYSSMKAQRGDVAGAARDLMAYLDSHPASARALRQLLMCNRSETVPYVERFFADADMEAHAELDATNMLMMLSMRGAHYSVTALAPSLAAYLHYDEGFIAIWVESLFALGRYREVAALIDHVQSMEEHIMMPIKGVAMAYAFAVSLLKTSQYERAKEFIAKVRPLVEKAIVEVPMALRMMCRTFLALADKVDKKSADDLLYWQYFNPLCYGKM